MPTAPSIDRTIARARRRIFLRRALNLGGWCLVAGLSTGVVLFLLGRLAALQVAPWMYGPIALIVVILPTTLAWRSRPTRQLTAVIIDHRLGLKDRLSTALFVRPRKNDTFAHHVIEQAQHATAHAQLARHFPLNPGRGWSCAAVVAALWLLLIMTLPHMDLFGFNRRRLEEQAAQRQSQTAQDELDKTQKMVQQLALATDTTDPAPRENPLENPSLDKLAKLSLPDLSTPQARRQAAAEISQIQQSLAEKSRQKERELDLIQNIMSRLDPQVSGPADRFVQAIRQGDLQTAQEAVRQLSDSVQDLPPDQRQALQQQLENLAQQLEQAAQQQQEHRQQADQQIQKALSDTGLDPRQIQQAQNQPTQQELQQYLEKQGLSPQQARKFSQQISQARQARQTHKQTDQICQDMSSSMRQIKQASQNSGGRQRQQNPDTTPVNPTNPPPAQQSLEQIARMQQQMRDLEAARNQSQRALSQLSDDPAHQKETLASQQDRDAQQDPTPLASRQTQDSKPGTADGGDPLGKYRRIHNIDSQAADDTTTPRQGPIIAWWLQNGPNDAAQPTVTYDQAAGQARHDAEQAINEDRVPKRYHEAIRQYFNQLPPSPSPAPTPPSAPQ